MHASGDKKVPFIDGFYFYYVPESKSHDCHVRTLVIHFLSPLPFPLSL